MKNDPKLMSGGWGLATPEPVNKRECGSTIEFEDNMFALKTIEDNNYAVT